MDLFDLLQRVGIVNKSDADRDFAKVYNGWWRKGGRAVAESLGYDITLATQKVLHETLDGLVRASSSLEVDGIDYELTRRVHSNELPIFAGLSPRKVLNVWIDRVRGGALISVTWNFARVVEVYCHYVAHAWEISDRSTQDDRQALATALRDVGSRFSEELDTLIERGTCSSVSPCASEEAKQFGAYLTGLVLEFAVAHEFAHLLCGHLGVGLYNHHPGRRSAVLQKARHVFSQSDELDADYVAMLLVSCVTDRVADEADGAEIQEQAIRRFFGAAILFELLEITTLRAIELSHPKLQERQVLQRARSTHPHPGWRLDRAVRAGLSAWGKPIDGVEPPLQVCDELGAILWAMRGRSTANMRFTRDQAALEAISELADDSSVGWVMDSYLTATKDLVVILDYRILKERLNTSLEIAKSAVAAAAAIYLTCVHRHYWVASHREQFALAHLFTIFEVIYATDRAESTAAEFAALVRAGVPEIDELVNMLAPVGAFG